MNKEEIRHFKSMLRQGSSRHMNIILDDKFQKELLNIIKDYEQLQQQKQKYKEVTDKAINNSQYWIDYYTKLNSDERIVLRLQENIDILKEVE